MADSKGSVLPSTPVEIGGEIRELRFGWRAIRAVEASTGLGYGQLFMELERGRIGVLVDLVWAGLLHTGTKTEAPPSIADVEGWFDELEDIGPVLDAVQDTAADALKIGDAEKKKA